MIVRPPFAPGVQACRHDGTVRAHVPGTAGGWQSTRHDRCSGTGQTPAST